MLKIIGWIFWIFLCILMFFLLLLLLPVRTRVRYDGKLTLWCGLGPVTLRLYPPKPSKKPKKKKPPREKTPRKKKKPDGAKPEKPKLTPELALEYLRLGVRGLKRLVRRLVLTDLTFHVTVAGEDAAKAALLYGRACGAVSAAYPLLDEAFRIKKSDIAVDMDFERTEPAALADVTVAACPLRLLIAGAVLLVQFLQIRRRSLRQTQTTKQEGGANEQHQ